MRANREYRAAARESLEGKWIEAAFASFVIIAIIMACNGINAIGEYFDRMASIRGSFSGLSSIADILVAIPLSLALYTGFLRMIRGSRNVLSETIMATIGDYFRYIAAGVISRVIIVVAAVCTFFLLGALGIYFAMAYAMVPYLLEDYPDMSWREAMTTSRRMMNGHKMELFMLQFSFIGWYLLGILTLGIGMFFVLPYEHATLAHYYEDLRHETLSEDEEENEVYEEAEVVE